MEWKRNEFTVTCDPAKLDHNVIAQYLASSYWARGIPPDIVSKSIASSLCFGLLAGTRQVGFARVISDYATIAHLGDVFILPDYNRSELAEWLMECIVSHPRLRDLRRWILATRDAHRLYAKFGFTPLRRCEIFVAHHDPNGTGSNHTIQESLR